MSDKKEIIKEITKEVMKVDWIEEQFDIAGKAAKAECKQDIKAAVKAGYKKATKNKVMFTKADKRGIVSTDATTYNPNRRSTTNNKTASEVLAKALVDYKSKDPICQNLVLISKDQLRSFIADSKKLDALEAGGVDNWSYYGEALHEGLEGTECDNYNELADTVINDLTSNSIEVEQLDDFDR